MTFLAALFVFVLDRLTKIAVAKNMSYGQSIHILPKIFNFTYVTNDGTAFSLFKGQNAILAAISVLAIIVIVFYVVTHKNSGPILSLALGLILGGALGNLVDRIKFGHVIDFLDFRVWPVFNIADSSLTIGISMLVITLLCTRYSLK